MVEESRPVYYLDGRRISSLESFYDEIERGLQPGAWGRNLNAFNDILRGGFGTPDENFTIVWQHADVSRERLGYDATVRHLRNIMSYCHPDHLPVLQQRLAEAERSVGPTVFDLLVEIIRDHDEGGPEENGVELRLE